MLCFGNVDLTFPRWMSSNISLNHSSVNFSPCTPFSSISSSFSLSIAISFSKVLPLVCFGCSVVFVWFGSGIDSVDFFLSHQSCILFFCLAAWAARFSMASSTHPIKYNSPSFCRTNSMAVQQLSKSLPRTFFISSSENFLCFFCALSKSK